jgi:hypothetical protein
MLDLHLDLGCAVPSSDTKPPTESKTFVVRSDLNKVSKRQPCHRFLSTAPIFTFSFQSSFPTLHASFCAVRSSNHFLCTLFSFNDLLYPTFHAPFMKTHDIRTLQHQLCSVQHARRFSPTMYITGQTALRNVGELYTV